MEIAKKYRNKLNPSDSCLPEGDVEYIRNKIKQKVESSLKKRIELGYENIDLEKVEEIIDEFFILLKLIP